MKLQSSLTTLCLSLVILFGMGFQCGNNNSSDPGERSSPSNRGKNGVKEIPDKGSDIPEIHNTAWQYLSITTEDGETTEATGGTSLRLEKANSRWTKISNMSGGSGVQYDAEGTYQVKGNRLILTHRNGGLYGDFNMNWDPDEQILNLEERSGSVTRLRFDGKLQVRE